MVIRHEDLVGTFEQKKALVSQFNLMDDTFFSIVMEHNDAENDSFGALSKQVNYHKIQGGVGDMCKAVEEYAKEYAKGREEKGRIEKSVEIVKNMLNDGLPINKALKYADIDRSTYDKYADQIR